MKNRYRYDKVEKKEEVKPVEDEVSIDEIAEEQAEKEDDVLVELAVENIEPAEEDQNEQVEEVVEEDHHDDFLTGEPLQVSSVKEDIWVECKPSCDLNFRSEPSSTAAIICVLKPEDVISVDWTDTEFVSAKTSDGVEGFVMKKFLDRI